jgi:hypothetical protein
MVQHQQAITALEIPSLAHRLYSYVKHYEFSCSILKCNHLYQMPFPCCLDITRLALHVFTQQESILRFLEIFQSTSQSNLSGRIQIKTRFHTNDKNNYRHKDKIPNSEAGLHTYSHCLVLSETFQFSSQSVATYKVINLYADIFCFGFASSSQIGTIKLIFIYLFLCTNNQYYHQFLCNLSKNKNISFL